MMHNTEINDQEVITEILGGNKNRYAVLMQKYNGRLYRICRGYMRQDAEIEDLMQETYVKAFLNLGQFENRSSFGTWITRILINETLQRLRRRDRQEVLAADQRSANPDTGNINPETTSMNRELKNILETNIEALPENYRLVFLLREVERLSVADTAESLGISEVNVKVRLSRAKEMLRRSLLKSYPLEELFEFHLSRCQRVADRVMTRLAAMGALQATLPN